MASLTPPKQNKNTRKKSTNRWPTMFVFSDAQKKTLFQFSNHISWMSEKSCFTFFRLTIHKCCVPRTWQCIWQPRGDDCLCSWAFRGTTTAGGQPGGQGHQHHGHPGGLGQEHNGQPCGHRWSSHLWEIATFTMTFAGRLSGTKGKAESKWTEFVKA